MKQILIAIFLLCLAATAVVGIGAITSGDMDENTARILITTAAAAFYSLIGLTCIAQLGKRWDLLGKLGLVFCALAMAHAGYTTWIKFEGIEVFQNRLALVVIGLAIGHACLMLLINPKNIAVTVLVIIAIASVAFNTLVTVSSIYAGSMGALIVLGVVGIVATATTIAAPALNLASS